MNGPESHRVSATFTTVGTADLPFQSPNDVPWRQGGCFSDRGGGEVHLSGSKKEGEPRESPVFLPSSGDLGRLLQLAPDKLHLHPALARLNLVSSVLDLNHAAQLKSRRLPAPIFITMSGTIFRGFREWHQAITEARPVVDCIQYSITDDETIEFLLRDHQPRSAWNNFSRVRLALELEPHFERKARANRIAGGRLKASANLPKAEHIEVREEIANLAGVGARTVANVKTTLNKAAPALIDALQDGTLTINRALGWCSLPAWKQVEQFADYVEQRTSSKVICDAITQSPIQSAGSDPSAVLRALQRHEARKPGSVVVRPSRRAQTVILLGQDLLSAPQFHTGLQEP